MSELTPLAAAGSQTAVNALAACVENQRVFCRVRALAAHALGASASEATLWGGLDVLQVRTLNPKP